MGTSVFAARQAGGVAGRRSSYPYRGAGEYMGTTSNDDIRILSAVSSQLAGEAIELCSRPDAGLRELHSETGYAPEESEPRRGRLQRKLSRTLPRTLMSEHAPDALVR